ncbi:HpcH/HpaI aldolase/citrate lyase family protein [Leisingera daeponensis]|uniref:HpcH/HpaI aldolase/citrate lyase family protein n=1 Tax=Leisingera daeponensis TaxID=405746 RepID=UPI001C981D37|nr:CoA ester lyase [Leisingera daeponensis]MBY6059529.1 CoA ester lyase [Leisingera daeponensis]
MTSPLSPAKSLLFVPGDRSDRIPKALDSTAHAVIVDLEDAVTPQCKDDARHQVAAFLQAHPEARVLLRVNASESPWFEDDLALAALPAIAGIVVPKASPTSLLQVAQNCQTPIWPLIETAEGIQRAPEISRFPGVVRILLGTIDLALDLDLDVTRPGGHNMLDIARFQVVSASIAAGIAPPVDGVFPDLDDADSLLAATSHAKACGFGGMMCIHPKQTSIVNGAFTPDDSQVDWAQRVLKAAQGQPGAFKFEGQMIDSPVLVRAARLLESWNVRPGRSPKRSSLPCPITAQKGENAK